MGSAMIEDLSGKAKWCKADEAEARIEKYRKLSVKRGDLLMMANDRINELEEMLAKAEDKNKYILKRLNEEDSFAFMQKKFLLNKYEK